MGSISIFHWLIVLTPAIGLVVIGLAIVMALRNRRK